jgi:hypothetical protein
MIFFDYFLRRIKLVIREFEMQQEAVNLILPCSFQGCKEPRPYFFSSPYCANHAVGWETCQACKSRVKKEEIVHFSSSFELRQVCKTCTKKICEFNEGKIDEQGNRLPQAPKAREEAFPFGSCNPFTARSSLQEPLSAAKAQAAVPAFIQSSFTFTSWKAVNVKELQGS